MTDAATKGLASHLAMGGCALLPYGIMYHAITNTIPGWVQIISTGTSATWDQTFAPKPGVQMGVWQALTTRNGGEVISADAY